MFDTKEEADQKLLGSVVFYNEVPVYIQGAKGSKSKLTLVYQTLPQGLNSDTRENLITDSLWNFKQLGSKLGYVEVRDQQDQTASVIWTSRIPSRHPRQGLDRTTVHLDLGNTIYSGTWEHLITTQGLVATLCGKFRSCSEIFKLITTDSKNFKALPLTRKLALTYDKVNPPNLLYRGHKVAYTENGEVFKLAKHKEFLREDLVDMEHLKIA